MEYIRTSKTSGYVRIRCIPYKRKFTGVSTTGEVMSCKYCGGDDCGSSAGGSTMCGGIKVYPDDYGSKRKGGVNEPPETDRPPPPPAPPRQSDAWQCPGCATWYSWLVKECRCQCRTTTSSTLYYDGTDSPYDLNAGHYRGVK